MEASVALSLQLCPWIGSERTGWKTGGFFRFPSGFSDERSVKTPRMGDSRWSRAAVGSRHLELKISCCRKNSGGMMGSGKTTVGKILSEVLGYSFFDSDKLVEQAVGISSVAQIFKEHSEAFFRDNESKVLKVLSSMHRLVVATGGGVVVRPINWKYMKQGITIWLDVPLDALARRIAAVGTDSRPLLHHGSGDPYTKAFVKLTTLSEKRGKAYTNADARVSLEYLAAQQGHGDVSALTPTAIAIEVLMKIECFLTGNAAVSNRSRLQ